MVLPYAKQIKEGKHWMQYRCILSEACSEYKLKQKASALLLENIDKLDVIF